jgi:hypothetical protein
MDDLRDASVLQTIAFASLGDLLLLCHTATAPRDDEWNAWVERAQRLQHRAMLISSRGGSPNSAQRARVAQIGGSDPRPPVALLTDSSVLRGLITAFTWLLGPEQRIKAFSPTATADAMRWLAIDVPPASVEAALAHLFHALSTRAR